MRKENKKKLYFQKTELIVKGLSVLNDATSNGKKRAKIDSAEMTHTWLRSERTFVDK